MHKPMIIWRGKSQCLAILLIFLLNGCATLSFYPPSTQQVTKSRDFKRPFEEVWNCTIESLIKKGDNLSSTDKGSGLIIIKNYESKVSEYELEKLVINAPMVEWQSRRVEGTILIRSLKEDSTRVVSNFKIIAKGIPYELRNESGERASFKDIFRGKAQKIPIAFYPQEYVLESNGSLEQSYFIMIADALLRLRNAGI